MKHIILVSIIITLVLLSQNTSAYYTKTIDNLDDTFVALRILLPRFSWVVENLNVTGILYAVEAHIINLTVTNVNVTNNEVINGNLTVLGDSILNNITVCDKCGIHDTTGDGFDFTITDVMTMNCSISMLNYSVSESNAYFVNSGGFYGVSARGPHCKFINSTDDLLDCYNLDFHMNNGDIEEVNTLYAVTVNVTNVFGDLGNFTNLTVGDTPTLFVDGVGNFVGIGIANPATRLHVHDSTSSDMRFTNTPTGTSATDGLFVGLGTYDAAAYIWNYENDFLSLGTNNAERVRIDSSGNTYFNENVNVTKNLTANKLRITDTEYIDSNVTNELSFHAAADDVGTSFYHGSNKILNIQWRNSGDGANKTSLFFPSAVYFDIGSHDTTKFLIGASWTYNYNHVISVGKYFWLQGDGATKGLYFGGGADANINYNGSDMIYDSQLVGDGDHVFKGGDVIVEENITATNIVANNITATYINSTYINAINITINNSGKIWSNATCMFITSPGGTETLGVCD